MNQARASTALLRKIDSNQPFSICLGILQPDGFPLEIEPFLRVLGSFWRSRRIEISRIRIRARTRTRAHIRTRAHTHARAHARDLKSGPYVDGNLFGWYLLGEIVSVRIWAVSDSVWGILAMIRSSEIKMSRSGRLESGLSQESQVCQLSSRSRV